MRRRGFLLSVLTCIVLVGSVSLAVGQLTSVKVGHSSFSDESVLYLARDIGIFKKHGIHIELIYIPGGSVAMQALLGKSLDLTMAGGTQLVYAQLKGADLRMIGGLNNRLPFVLMAREGITSAEQLRGKKVGISRFGSNTDFVVKLAATQLGLNSKRDIQVIQVGPQETRMVAMKTGVIDATVLGPELVLVGRKFGFNPLLDFVAKGIEYQHAGVAARTDYLKSQGALVQGLGYALCEEMGIEDGRVQVSSLGDYKIYCVRDVPPLVSSFVTSTVGPGPFSAKAVGEAGISIVAPAIANAVCDATGVRITQLPITPEKIIKGLPSSGLRRR